MKRDIEKYRQWQQRSRDRAIEKRKLKPPTPFHRKEKGQGIPKPRKPLKKQSQRQKRKLNEYYEARKEYLATHPACIICLVRDMHPAPATEVHHIYGRGPNIADPRGFASSCRACRDWPHENPVEARRLGVLGPASLWMVPIDKHPKNK